MKIGNIFVNPKLIKGGINSYKIRTRYIYINFNHNKSLVYTRNFYRDFFVGDFL